MTVVPHQTPGPSRPLFLHLDKFTSLRLGQLPGVRPTLRAACLCEACTWAHLAFSEPSLPASEVADEPPTLTKEEPVPLETQMAEEEEDSGAPPLKRFCVDQPAVPQTASES